MGRSFFLPPVALAVVALLACAAYWPGLSGGYLYDDYPHIVDNAGIRLDGLSVREAVGSMLSGTAGPLKRPLSMLSFALNYRLSGLDPFYFKLTNLLLHVLSGLVLYRVICLLLGPGCTARPATAEPNWGRQVALAVTAAWLLHPLNLTTVLYVVQRMTGLASLFVLLGVLAYLSARAPGRSRPARLGLLYAGVGGCGLLGALCKETAVLLPLFLLVVELTLRERRSDPDLRRDLRWFFLATLAAPGVLLLLTLALDPDLVLRAYDVRSFSLTERLLTQARVLWFYLSLLIWPTPERLGFYHDDFTLSVGLLAPPTTALALAGLAGLLALGWGLRRRAPLVTFGIAWFLAGHLLESTFLSLELVHEHRNYLPMVGPLVACFGLLFARQSQLRLSRLAAFALVALLGIQTSARAIQWQERVGHALLEVEHHPRSSQAHYELGRLLHHIYTETKSAEVLARSQSHFERAAELDPTRAKPVFAQIANAFAGGGAPEPSLLAELLRRLRDYPLPADGVADFYALVECHKGGPCALDPNDMLALFGAALERPSLHPSQRSQLLTELADWYAAVLGDFPAAVAVLQDVREADPGSLQSRLNLIRVLILSGQHLEARREIAAARAMDTWEDRQLSAAHRDEALAELEALMATVALPPSSLD